MQTFRYINSGCKSRLEYYIFLYTCQQGTFFRMRSRVLLRFVLQTRLSLENRPRLLVKRDHSPLHGGNSSGTENYRTSSLDLEQDNSAASRTIRNHINQTQTKVDPCDFSTNDLDPTQILSSKKQEKKIRQYTPIQVPTHTLQTSTDKILHHYNYMRNNYNQLNHNF